MFYLFVSILLLLVPAIDLSWAVENPVPISKEDSLLPPTLEKGGFALEVKDNLINLQAEQASFKEILNDLEKKTGIKVNIFDGVEDKKVTLDIRSLPIYAIHTILEKMEIENFAVVYDKQLASKVIYVLPEGQDIAEVLKGKTIIRPARFADGKDVNQIKGHEIATITIGKNNIPIRYVKDELLLKFHLGVTKEEKEEVLKKHNLILVDDKSLSKIGYVKARIPDGREVFEVIKEIRNEYKVKIPEPNYIAAILTVNDPLYENQWYVQDTSFDKAWGVTKNTGQVKVAVIDTGVNAEHPDLKDRILQGYDFVNNDSDTSDHHGHGTFVTGIIAAASNDIGIKGLYDYAQVIPVKAINENGIGTYEDTAKGIIYAVDNGAKVINLSIGGYGYSFMLQDAVDYALEKGCIVVAAGGNDGIEQEIYPAGYPDVIGVSALDSNGQIWSSSNSGRHIDISAPGVNILSTGLNNDYVYATGTSASAPMVSALAAILISERAGLSSSVLERLIMQSAKDLGEQGRDKIYGSGEIDALASLDQEVKPFHDVAVRSVSVEPMVFEKGKPTYIVANIENAGTFTSEKFDVVLYEIVGEEKKEIGRKEELEVVDKTKVIFEWKPEGVGENVKFEVLVVPENDVHSSNNTKTTYSFSMKQSDGVYVLYKTEPPVHQWIAAQAYYKLVLDESPNNNFNASLKNEISKYIPTDLNSSYYASNFAPPSEWGQALDPPGKWGNMTNAPYCTSAPCETALLEGVWEEDQTYYFEKYASYCSHFWKPDDGYGSGYSGPCFDYAAYYPGIPFYLIIYDDYYSALQIAQANFNKALDYYKNNKNAAYYWLGRTAHILMDMTVPEHVNLDIHIIDTASWAFMFSSYEKFTGDYYTNIFWWDSNTDIPDIFSNEILYADRNLSGLFYKLASFTRGFDSNDREGKCYKYGRGKYNQQGTELDINKVVARADVYELTLAHPIDGEYRYTLRRFNNNDDECNPLLIPDYDIFNNGSKHYIYYYKSFYDKYNNDPKHYVRIVYTDTTHLDDKIWNVTGYDINDWILKDIYQPELQARAIGYVAALYQLFWERTHPSPSNLGQYGANGITSIPEESTVTTPSEATVVFKGTVSDPEGDNVRLEIELRQMGENFTGALTNNSNYVTSGNIVSITRYSLVAGSYHWRARVCDINNICSLWKEYGTSGNKDFSVAIDNTKPIVSITYPANKASVSGTIPVTVSTDDNVGVTKVNYYLDNSSIVSGVSTSSPFSWSWNTTTVANGIHSIKAIAYDAAQNLSMPYTITVTVNNSTGNNTPNVPTNLKQYKSDGTTVISVGGTTNERTVVMKGGVTDPDNNAVSLEVEVKPVGTVFSNLPSSNCSPGVSVVSGGTAVVTCSGLSDGQYHWQARAKDSNAVSGWQGAGNPDPSADFIVSAGSGGGNRIPEVTVISPNGGETLIAGSSYTVRWFATDDQQVQSIGLLYSTGGGANWTSIVPVIANTGSHQWAVPNISTTTAKIAVLAYDEQLTGIGYSNSNFSIVQNCPKPSIPNLQNITPSGSSYTVSWIDSSGASYYNLQEDTSSLFTNPTVVYARDGTSWYSGNKLPGTYYYRVKAINNCGEIISNIQSVTIQANQGPGEITALNPYDGAPNQPLSLTLRWSASHPGVESLRFNVYVCQYDTAYFSNYCVKSYGQTATTFSLSNLPYNTTISWGIEAIDGTGDRRFSSMFHFTTIADSSAPTGSILINNSAVTTTSYSVTLNLSASDADSGVERMRFSNNGVNWSDWVYYVQQYPWNLADYNYGGSTGKTTYTVYARFRDAQGNESIVYTDAIDKVVGTPGNIILNGVYYETIRDAINAANAGDTIYLTEGTYTISYVANEPRFPSTAVGLVLKPGVTLKGVGAEKTSIVLEGGGMFTIADADNSVIEGLTIINSVPSSGLYAVLLESNSSKIRNCIIKGGYKGIQAGYDSTRQALNSEISNNLIVNNNQCGIDITSDISDVTNISILNNTIANNLTCGISSARPSTTIVNNIVANNGFQGITPGWFGEIPIIRYNNVYNNGTNYDGGIPNQTGINDNISVNPLFVNPSAGDYHLNSGSPCITAGTNVGIPYSGSAPDMGAFEYNGTGTVQVTSNRTDASFTIKGPSGTYDGSGSSWSMPSLPIGIYTITFTPIANFYSPPYQAKMLYSGQTFSFDGTYLNDTFGPTGTMSINFDEYATADNLVTITFDLTDEVGGLGAGSQMMFSNDGVTWSTVEPYSSIKKYWDLTRYGGNSISGTKIVYAKVSDVLGNWTILTDIILYVPNRQALEVPTQYSAIQYAIDAAQDGDTVYVYPGTYEVNLILKPGVRLQGAGPSQTFLNQKPSGTGIIITTASNSMVDGFTIGKIEGGYKSILINGSSTIASNNIIYGIRGIEDNGYSNLIIRNNVFRTSCMGIFMLGETTAKVQNNTITSNPSIYGCSPMTGIILSNATALTRVNNINNIIANNGIGITESSPYETEHQHIFSSFNTYWNNTSGNFGAGSYFNKMEAGDMTSDPLFVDSANGDFHLQPGSSSINSGNPEARYNDTDGSRNDKGAYCGPTLNTPPKADFNIEPPQGGTGTIFTFDASLSHDGESRDGELEVRWDLDGDGDYDTTFTKNKIITHMYTALGTFNVKLQVKDKGGFLSTDIASVSVINQSPNVPSNPMPADGSTGQPVDVTLIWNGGDPDPDDVVTYDVYFGTSSTPSLISSDQTETYFNPGTLDPNAVYYWKIVSKDSQGDSSISPLWYFVTGYDNKQPSADPNGPYSGTEGQAITLDGSGSSDTDGSIVLYKWDVDNDGNYEYISASPTQNHTYAQDGTYTLKLRVTDNLGATDEISTIANISDTSPTADFSGNPTSGIALLQVNFTNNSTGYDQPLSYNWGFGDGETSTEENPTHTYASAGTYSVSLTVTDSDGSTDTLIKENYIRVNEPPIANAGPDRNAMVASKVTLDGSDSYDPERGTITFQWTFTGVPAGSSVTDASLSDATSAKPSFTPDAEGTYTLELTVNDGVSTDTDQVSINAYLPNVPPNANAGPDQNALTGSTVYLDGSASNDPDNAPLPLSYLWSFNSIPAGSALTDNDITDKDQVTANFITDLDGTYVLRLTVDDGDLTSEDLVQITASPSNVPPNADAGDDITIALGDAGVCDGSASNDPDNAPQPLTYDWSFVSVPTGSSISDSDITDSNTASPSFTPDVTGTYVLELMVSDSQNNDFNNIAVTVINVDLIITSVSNPPASKKRGKNFVVKAKVKNNGDGAADKEFTIGYYLSKNRDKRINKEADILLTGDVIVSPLVAGASSTKKIQVNIGNDTPPGKDYVKVCADNRNDFAESNEDNNCRASVKKIRVK